MIKSKLSRRQLLASLSSTLGAGLLSAPKSLANSLLPTRVDVIIVGAGLSGLAAANSLAKQGAKVIVLEAKTRIGGRVFTDNSMGAPFEVGAGWVHGPSKQNPVMALVEESQGQGFVTENDGLTLFDEEGEDVSEHRLAEIEEDWSDLLALIDEEAEGNQNLYAAIADQQPQALDDPGLVWALSAYTEFAKGGPIEKLSAKLFDEDKAYEGDDIILTNGLGRILGPLAQGLDIRLSTRVSAINHHATGAKVQTDQGTFEAAFVICSAPLGVLKAGNIAFSPPLPSKHQKSIDRLGFGSVTKIALKFDQAFWDVEEHYFGIMTQDKGRWNYWLNYRTFCDENILLGLSMGDYALKADYMSDEAMAEDALDVLKLVWEEQVTTPSQILTTHWSQDPETLGAYSYPTPNSAKQDFDRLADPIHKRLFLVGEHTIFAYQGTMHGAILSGQKAAKQIAALL